MVVTTAEDMNNKMEATEEDCMDCMGERKQQRGRKDTVFSVAHDRWACSEPGFVVVAQSKVGLVNHTDYKNTPRCTAPVEVC